MYNCTGVFIPGQPDVPALVLTPAVDIVPSLFTASVAVGGHCIVTVGGEVVSGPALVNVTEITLPKLPAPFDLALESSVPIAEIPVPPLEIEIVGGLAVPRP